MIIKRVKSLLEGYDLTVDTNALSNKFGNVSRLARENNIKEVVNNASQQIAQRYNDPKLADVIAQSILDTTANSTNRGEEVNKQLNGDYTKNAFLKLMKNIDGDPKAYKDMSGKLGFLYSQFKNDPNYFENEAIKPLVYKESFYADRDLNGLKYTVAAMEMCSDESEMKKYFEDPSVADVKEFFYPNGDVKAPRDIYQTIEDWENKHGTSKEDKSQKHSLNDYLKSQELNIDNKGEVTHDLDKMSDDEKIETINNFLYSFGGTKYDKNDNAIVNSIDRFVKRKLYNIDLIPAKMFVQEEPANIARLIIKYMLDNIGGPELRQAFTTNKK